MKKVPSLLNLAKLGVAALIVAAPVTSSAQTVTGRIATPGLSAAIVPTLGTGLGAPTITGSFGPSALSLTPTLAAPSVALTPLPSQETMPNACAGVPRNRWCGDGDDRSDFVRNVLDRKSVV